MPTAESRPSALTKPTTGGSGRSSASDRVFVSPRVVDEQAFREFSSELRSMIDQVRSAQAELVAAGDTASETAKNLSGSQDRYRQHLGLTTKLLKALTAKSSEVEATLSRLDERLDAVRSAESSVENAIDAKVRAFEAKLEERLSRVEADYERRLRELQDGFETRTTSLEQAWAAEETAVRERIESQRVFVQTGLSAQADEIESMLKERASELTADIGRSLSDEREHAEKTLAELREQREAFAGETGESLDNTLEQLRTACEIASKLVGWNPADPNADPDKPSAGSLGDLVRQATKTREDAEWSVRRLGSLRDQAQSTISELSESLDGSIALFDQLHAQKRKLDGSVGAVLEHAEASSLELKSRQAEIEELVAPLSESLQKAERVTRDLCSVADGAADLLEHAGTVHGDLEAVLTTARQLTETLAPWRTVILESAETAELPPAIAAVVERFEAELGRDLAKMATAMQAIADRAEAPVQAARTAGGLPEIVVRQRVDSEPSADSVGGDEATA